MRKISQREKLLLQVLSGIMVLVIIYFLIISPLMKLKSSGENELKSNLDNLNKIDKVYQEYKEIQQKKTQIKSLLDKKTENVTSMIEQWANSSNIAKNIAYTRRSESKMQNKYNRVTTDVKFEGVGIDKFLKFLYDLENSNILLKISYIRINQALKGANTYDVILKIDSFTAL
jgi:type II secretory pathway component PulM